MRCATPVNLVTFAATTGATRVVTPSLRVGAEGAVCVTGEYVVLSRAEFETATASPFYLSTSDAGYVAGAVILVWAFGFGIRSLIQTLRSDVRPTDAGE